MSVADMATGIEDGVVAGKKGPRADRPKRRSFTPEYKLAVLAEYEMLTEPGARGALLRREGLYSSHIVEWKRVRDAGSLDALAVKPSGPKPGKSEAERRAEKLEADNARLVEELSKVTKANEILGKLAGVVELLSTTSDDENKQTR
jgi:transposase-like protein